MTKYTLLKPVVPADKCYLFEVLYWRAFGRLPEAYWDGYVPWRFSDDVRDSYEAPTPEGKMLSEEECSFAGLPFDPRMKALQDETETLDPDHYKKFLKIIEDSHRAGKFSEDEFKTQKDRLEQELQETISYHDELENWLPYFEDYIDQFQNEICLDLRNGSITGYGTEIAAKNTEEIADFLMGDDVDFHDPNGDAIPKENWITKNILWEESLLLGRTTSFIWVYFEIDEILERYPPELFVDPTKAFPIGSTVALVGGSGTIPSQGSAKRGRPALPWEAFHVEVARLYLDGAMPAKKEAAIVLLQEWFRQSTGKEVGRSAIGQKLKPYFDELRPKDTK